MSPERKEICDLCERAGHSPFKALEIALDYERRDPLAMRWIAGLRAMEKQKGAELAQ